MQMDQNKEDKTYGWMQQTNAQTHTQITQSNDLNPARTYALRLQSASLANAALCRSHRSLRKCEDEAENVKSESVRTGARTEVVNELGGENSLYNKIESKNDFKDTITRDLTNSQNNVSNNNKNNSNNNNNNDNGDDYPDTNSTTNNNENNYNYSNVDRDSHEVACSSPLSTGLSILQRAIDISTKNQVKLSKFPAILTCKMLSTMSTVELMDASFHNSFPDNLLLRARKICILEKLKK